MLDITVEDKYTSYKLTHTGNAREHLNIVVTRSVEINANASSGSLVKVLCLAAPSVGQIFHLGEENHLIRKLQKFPEDSPYRS